MEGAAAVEDTVEDTAGGPVVAAPVGLLVGAPVETPFGAAVGPPAEAPAKGLVKGPGPAELERDTGPVQGWPVVTGGRDEGRSSEAGAGSPLLVLLASSVAAVVPVLSTPASMPGVSAATPGVLSGTLVDSDSPVPVGALLLLEA